MVQADRSSSVSFFILCGGGIDLHQSTVLTVVEV